MPPATNTPPKHSAAPERSLLQRMDALQRANEIRPRRAQLKKDLKAGRVSIHTLLMDPPEYLQTAKVFDMLLAVPKYGRVKVNKVLQQCRISPSKTIGGLSQRQRSELVPELELSVSATTRAPRPGEEDGVDYHFLTDGDFERRVKAGEFVEHATYSGRRYGTLRSELDRRLRDGHPVVLEIEVQGARQVRRTMPEALQVFIAPPSREALRARLVGRGTDDPAQVDARLRTADAELDAQHEFARVVVNDRLEDAVDELTAIVREALREQRDGG